MARDTSSLRDILFDELEGLRSGQTDPKQAQAVAKLSAQIISTAKVELEYHRLRMRATEAGQDLVLGSMDLGSRAVSAVATKADSASPELVDQREKSQG